MSASPAEPGARDPRELSAEDAVDVDLISPRLVLPKVRGAVAVGLIVAVLVAIILAVVAGPLWGRWRSSPGRHPARSAMRASRVVG